MTLDEFKAVIDSLKSFIFKSSKDGDIIFYVTWRGERRWIVLDDFTIFPANEPEHIEIFLQLYQDITYLEFNIKEDMCFYIRQEILKSSLLNPPSFLSDVKKDLGKVVEIAGEKYILVGLSATLEDYYYICLTKGGKIMEHTCCGVYKVCQGERIYIPPSRQLQILSRRFSDPLCTEICLLMI